MLLVGCHLQIHQIQRLGFKHLGFEISPYGTTFQLTVNQSVQTNNTGGDASSPQELPTREDAGAAGIQGGPVSAKLFPSVHSQLKNETSVQSKRASKLPSLSLVKAELEENSLVWAPARLKFSLPSDSSPRNRPPWKVWVCRARHLHKSLFSLL